MNLPHPLNFEISSPRRVSQAFLQLGLVSFPSAAEYIMKLPYGRNAHKRDPLIVLDEGKGTCSTKHALLKMLADENYLIGMDLVIGLYHMNSINTPRVAEILEKHHLDSIPEAHCYLQYGTTIYDFTGETELLFQPDLIKEITIEPNQIDDFKINYHQAYMKFWADKHGLNLTVQDLFNIREQCIARLTEVSVIK